MVKIEKYIPISFTALAVFSCYMMTFVSMPFLEYYNKIKYLLMLFVYVYVIYNYKSLSFKEFLLVEKISLFLYVLFSFIASYFNLGKVTSVGLIAQCISQCGVLIANFLLVIVLKNKKRLSSMLEIFLWTSGIIWMISDISVFFKISNGGNYFFGTKFTIAYHHIRTLVLLILYIKEWNKKNKILFTFVLTETILVSIVSGCATGIVGTIIFIFFIFCNRKYKFVQNPFFQTAILLLCTMFPFWYNILLNNNLVQYLVEEVFHKQITLTGRTEIYSNIPLIFGDHILWGYGIGSNMDICLRWGAINIQNGMLKILMESGVFGALMVFILYFSVFWRVKRTDTTIVKVLSSYLLVFSILSSIEITINIVTLSILLYISVISDYEKESESGAFGYRARSEIMPQDKLYENVTDGFVAVNKNERSTF